MKLLNIFYGLCLIAILVCIQSCSSSESSVADDNDSDGHSTESSSLNSDLKVTKVDETPNNLAVPDNRFAESYRILLYGNSHVGGLDEKIKTLLLSNEAVADVEVEYCGAGFLDNLRNDEKAINKLLDGQWTHAIFQGQKYSQSGTTSYPTIAAQSWITDAKSVSATPILFPEHPQIGNPGEGKMLYELHVKISQEQMSCVAPVGLIWNRLLQTAPQTELHDPDGNHASDVGQWLTAMIFYQTITGESAELLPYQSGIEIDEEQQALFRQIVSDTIAEYPTCPFN